MWTDSLHLSSTSKAALAALPTRDVPRGSVMFRPGDVAQGFVVVLSGRIEVRLTAASGREILLYAVEPGESCVQTTLGLSNISFGLNPAARQVLNSVFLHECIEAGLDSAIVHASKILPIARIGEEQLKVARDLVYDRREYAEDGTVSYDPLGRFLDLFAGVSAQVSKETKAEELAALPLAERLEALRAAAELAAELL